MTKYITCNLNPNNQHRGIGHQFSCFLVPYILSRKYSLKLVWQPFKGENDGTLAPKKSNAFQIDQPVKLWNRFLNIDENELTLTDIKNIEKIELPYIEKCKWGYEIFNQTFSQIYNQDILFIVPDIKDGMFIDIDWKIFNNNYLRDKYNLAKSKQPQTTNYLNKDCVNIAIHRRAGDVTKNTPFNRWIDLDYYINIINNINKIQFSKKHTIHFYSYDIDQEELDRLKNLPNIEYHVNENTFDTFHNMVNCDIIINGQSTFSIMACYLSYAIKLCTPFGIHWNNFPNQKDLIIINSNGDFDSNKLLKTLEDKNG